MSGSSDPEYIWALPSICIVSIWTILDMHVWSNLHGQDFLNGLVYIASSGFHSNTPSWYFPLDSELPWGH